MLHNALSRIITDRYIVVSKKNSGNFFLQNILLLLIILSLLGSIESCESSTEKKGLHPNLNHLPSEEKVDHIVNLLGKNDSLIPPFYDLDSLEKIGEVGSNTNIEFEYYETPKKIDIDPRGYIYIVHEEGNSVNVYNRAGEFQYEIGRGGRGPGEFNRINSFDFSRDYEKLYILDFFEVEIFKWEGDKYVYSTSFNTKLQRAYDICVLDDLYISGYSMGKNDLNSYKEGNKPLEEINHVSGPIIKYSKNSFDKISSLGYKYESYSNIGPADGKLSEMILDCNKSTNTIVAFLKHFPFAFGYNQKEKLKWISKIKNFKSTQITEFTEADGSFGMYFYSNEDKFHRFYSFKETDSKFSTIQIYNSLPQSNFATSDTLTINKSKYYTVLIDSETGEIFKSDEFGLIGAHKMNTVVAIEANYEKSLRQMKIYEVK